MSVFCVYMSVFECKFGFEFRNRSISPTFLRFFSFATDHVSRSKADIQGSESIANSFIIQIYFKRKQ